MATVYVLAAAVVIFGLISAVILSLPSCADNEVMVRAVWGFACVEGHR